MLELNPCDISKQLLDLKNLKPIIYSFTPKEVLTFLDVLGDACQQHIASNEDDCRDYLRRVEIIKLRVQAFSAQHVAKLISMEPNQVCKDALHYRKMYKYDDGGRLKVWSGRGRMPKRIKEALASGKRLEDFESK